LGHKGQADRRVHGYGYQREGPHSSGIPALQNPSAYTAVSSSETKRHAHQAALAIAMTTTVVKVMTVRGGITLRATVVRSAVIFDNRVYLLIRPHQP
jgi:hypothetical protein